jgi:hypothetical protein
MFYRFAKMRKMGAMFFLYILSVSRISYVKGEKDTVIKDI